MTTYPINRRKHAKKLSLRTLLIVPFVIQIFAAVGLIGYFSFRNGQESVNEVASQLRREITARIKERLLLYLATPHIINRTNVSAARFGTLNLKDANMTSDYFWQQIQVFELVNLIYVGNEQGEYVGATRHGNKITVNQANKSSNNYYRIYIPDDRGHPTKLISEANRKYDPRRRPWYVATAQAHRPIWSSIYTFFNPPSLGITATNPLYTSDGKLVAVFATDLSLATISQFLSSLKVGKTGQSFIMERSGLLIATSTAESPYRLNREGNLEPITGERSRNPITKATAQYLHNYFGNLRRIDRPQQLSFEFDRQRLFLEVDPTKDAYGIDWLTVTVIPEADFMEQINANARTTILLCLLTLGLVTVAGIVISRWITRPILLLSAASRAIAQGELKRQVDVEGINELEALGQSFNQMAQQLQESFTALENANRELEVRVEERTVELKVASQEIGLLYEQLQEENLRISAELDIARQVQQIILPKAHELTQIPHLDIAGFMEAAHEVGGDYYDVLTYNGGVKIGIGDVCGHGLESGIVMLMVQTAVRTLMENHETDPIEFLSAINRVIYANVQRINPDKNLTLALLDYQDGQVNLSGQHEEVLIVRSGGEVERIDTSDLGFPIGLVDDIAGFVAQTQILLNPGDGVVLYTDGITEAENAKRKLYGLEQLIEVVSQNWQYGADAIRQAVVDDVRSHVGQHIIYDDMTLVVIKRKA